MSKYEEVGIDKKSLDTIQEYDMVRFNEMKRGMRVMAVSENYFILTTKAFGSYIYSIIHKNPFDQNRNEMKKGFPIASPDNLIFGRYDYSKETDCYRALQNLESEDGNLSWSRYGVAIERIFVKRDTKHI